MDFESFEKLVSRVKAVKPVLFGLEHDRILSCEEIRTFENENGITLPDEYRRFLGAYGGGYFGFVNIYSPDEDSNFYILKYLKCVPENYLPVADNGCGDFYVLEMKECAYDSKLYFFDHETGQVKKTEYSDVLEYLAGAGLGMKM